MQTVAAVSKSGKALQAFCQPKSVDVATLNISPPEWHCLMLYLTENLKGS